MAREPRSQFLRRAPVFSWIDRENAEQTIGLCRGQTQGGERRASQQHSRCFGRIVEESFWPLQWVALTNPFHPKGADLSVSVSVETKPDQLLGYARSIPFPHQDQFPSHRDPVAQFSLVIPSARAL